MSPTGAAPAMTHGVRSGLAATGAVPTPGPHRGQNRSPGATGAPQLRQAEEHRGAPQVEQKRPVPVAPQDVQVVAALVITGIHAR
jgi:hypothetical protein